MRLKTSLLMLAAVLLSAPAARAQEVVTMASLTDPAYESALWAAINGKVKDPGVTLKVDVMAIPALIQAVMTAQYNIIPNGVLTIPQSKDGGITWKIMGAILRYHPEGHSNDLWVLKDSPIKSIADIKGKTVAVTAIEAQNVVSIRATLNEKYKMNAAATGGDIRWVAMPAAQHEAALQAGRVDAVVFGNVQAYAIAKTGKYRSILHNSKELEQMYGGPMPSIMITGYGPDMEKRPEAYKAAARVLRDSARYALAHQDEVFGAVAPKYKMEPQDLKVYFTTYAQLPLAMGPTDKSVIMKAWQSGHKLGVLPNVPDSVEPFMWQYALSE